MMAGLNDLKTIVTSEEVSHIPDPAEKFLGDLGKPTLRGVRRCAKCGTFNGTRGIKCKNALCDMRFSKNDVKKYQQVQGPLSVKITTDPAIQIYSVRGKGGSDSRGFVQLPIVQDLEGNPAVVDPGIVCSAARCYVDACHRAQEESQEPCAHIKNSVESIDETEELPFDLSTLTKFSLTLIPADVRQQIKELYDEKCGPLVQKVQKNIMVVRSHPSTGNFIGYVHCLFHPQRKDEKKFSCTCKESKTTRLWMSQVGDQYSYKIQRCLHYYICLCSFSSCPDLSQEFSFMMTINSPMKTVVHGDMPSTIASSAEVQQAGMIIEEENMINGNIELSTHEVHNADETTVEEIVEGNTAIQQLVENASSYTIEPDNVYSPLEAKKFKHEPVVQIQQISSGLVSWTFAHWRKCVAEQINETMHYQLPGTPEPLVHIIPHLFWECMSHRIALSGDGNRRRLPDVTETIIRKTAPIGEFIKYTWYIKEMQQVRNIFDDQDVALLISKYFIKNRNGSFSNSQTPRVQVDTIVKSSEPRPTSKYHEYKTYLKVGNHGGKIYPFIIEWTPSLYPVTKMGEVRLTFQYGHMIDGLAPSTSNTDELIHIPLGRVELIR